MLGQISGPNGEIIDAKTGKVVVPAPGKSVPGDNGLGEGEDRLEVVASACPSPKLRPVSKWLICLL